jgi:hypothetical protein
VEDTFGMITDVDILDHSLNTGTNKDHVYFNTICKTRSAISNFKRTGASELAHPSLAGYKLGERIAFMKTPIYSLWFDRLVVGSQILMGDDIILYRARSIELLL